MKNLTNFEIMLVSGGSDASRGDNMCMRSDYPSPIGDEAAEKLVLSIDKAFEDPAYAVLGFLQLMSELPAQIPAGTPGVDNPMGDVTGYP